MNIDFGRAVIAGVVGTVVMTVVGLYVAPLMGMPPMNPAEMLAGAMGGVMTLGWIAHFMIGIILAFGYALVARAIPGPAVVRGALYGLAPWLLAQVAVMPMMGMPFFSGFGVAAVGSLVGHLVYGGVVGGVYGVASERSPASVTV